MTPSEFYNTYISFAKESEVKTKVPALFTLAQAALESGWGAKVKGNNFFGIKAKLGQDGIEFLTTEYNKKTGLWTKIKQYFRRYDTPADSFVDHGNFLRNNKRYAKAFYFTKDPYLFAREVAKAGYATDPHYFDKIVSIIGLLER